MAGRPVLYFQNYLYVSVMWEAQLLPTTSILSDLTVTRKGGYFHAPLGEAAVPNQCIPPSGNHHRLHATVRTEGFCRVTLRTLGLSTGDTVI